MRMKHLQQFSSEHLRYTQQCKPCTAVHPFVFRVLPVGTVFTFHRAMIRGKLLLPQPTTQQSFSLSFELIPGLLLPLPA